MKKSDCIERWKLQRKRWEIKVDVRNMAIDGLASTLVFLGDVRSVNDLGEQFIDSVAKNLKWIGKHVILNRATVNRHCLYALDMQRERERNATKK